MAEQPDSPVPADRDPREPAARLLRDLASRPDGLTGREAARRLLHYGPNELTRRAGTSWLTDLARQLAHPLALLLWAAAVLAWLAGTAMLGVAIIAVIVINAILAFVQERQAERAVETLSGYLPQQAAVVRDGQEIRIPARDLVPGDVLIIDEGERISADARLLTGAIEVDLSALTGESQPAYRSADLTDLTGPLLHARDLVFSGTTCLGGQARALVFATGMHTEIGRIAALSQRTGRDESPLEKQVRRVAWLIAAVSLGAGAVFFPIGIFAAGMPVTDAFSFAIGLLVANVPEGLLPTITLALAMGARALARLGAVVKRLSSVETLGSTTIICTDKTGTLTENQMRVTTAWAAGQMSTVDECGPAKREPDNPMRLLARAALLCTNATYSPDSPESATGDPTEVALVRFAANIASIATLTEGTVRRGQFHFDPALRLMSTMDEDATGLWLNTKGAPEEILARATHILDHFGHPRALDDNDRADMRSALGNLAGQGLRLLGIARRRLRRPLEVRAEAERDLTVLGFVAMLDPPRIAVNEAVRHCHDAGIRIIMVTGDHPVTAAAVAGKVGIARGEPTVVTGDDLDPMPEANLDALLEHTPELVFARISPGAKLRIAEAFQATGHVVAMTGDGINDAPALRRCDIGVAMGRSGTDVAREAATVVLTDDNFATIVAAVRTGRQVYDNVRKFILYIFAHTVPEVVPFLVFALSGGAVPLPLTVMQILAIDLGTETLPALALGREPAEPGLMHRPPRSRRQRIIDRPMLVRAWGYLGGISAVLVMTGFFAVLWRGGWTPGADVAPGTALHDTYLQASTATFLGIVACQIGTAFAARTEHAALRAVGVTSNRLLLWGIAFEVLVAAAVVTSRPLREVFGTAIPHPITLLILLPFPVIVWGSDELRRWLVRRTHRRTGPGG